MYERMLNKNEKPTAEQMASYCGATSTMFTELNEWISNGDSTVQTIVFPYGNNLPRLRRPCCRHGRRRSRRDTGWTPRVRAAQRSTARLPWEW